MTNVRRAVFRHTIPVDGNEHDLTISGRIVHVATRGSDYVEIWTDSLLADGEPVRAQTRTFTVYGTGHTVGSIREEFIGTAIVPGGVLVWHLFEVIP